MTNQEKIQKRDNFVKILNQDLEKNLDFDFTRPEMITAFVDKYYNDVSFFINQDKDVVNVCAPTIKQEHSNVYIELGEITDDEYEVRVHWNSKTEAIVKKFLLRKTPDLKIEYNENGEICINNIAQSFIVSRFYEKGLWFLNYFNKTTINFVATIFVAQCMFPRIGIKNLKDYIDRLETNLWLSEETEVVKIKTDGSDDINVNVNNHTPTT